MSEPVRPDGLAAVPEPLAPGGKAGGTSSETTGPGGGPSASSGGLADTDSAIKPDAGDEREDRRRRRRRLRRKLRERGERRGAHAARDAADREAAITRAAEASRELRSARIRRVALVFSILVGGPTLIAAAYYGAIATPEYESVAVLAVDQGEPVERSEPLSRKGVALDPLLQAVRARLLSRSQLTVLDHDQALVRHYQESKVDWLSRLDRDAGPEAAHSHYLEKVAITGGADGATLTVGARAFSAKRAEQVARALVAAAERFVERSSERARRDLEKAAASGLESARGRLARARAAPADPSSELELELAREQLQSAQRAAEMARVEAARRHRHLVVVAEPSLPDRASYPRRAWSVATVFFGALVLVIVLWLLVAVVREHAEL